MRKLTSTIAILLSISLLFAGCTITDVFKHRDTKGYTQFIVDFNGRIFAFNDEETGYDKIKSTITKTDNEKGCIYCEFEKYGVSFIGEYMANKINYTINGDYPQEEIDNAFDSVYNEYLESLTNYRDKAEIGTIEEETTTDGKIIYFTISGNMYCYEFITNSDNPTIKFYIEVIA